MKVSHAIVAICAAAAIGAAAVVALSRPKIAPPPLKMRTTGSFRLSGPFGPNFAGEMIAAGAGLFKGEKLQIELRPGSAESDPIKTVASGKDTIGVTSAHRLLIARSKGLPLVAFAGAYLESPVVFYALQQSGIRTPNDFVGKRIGYHAGQDTALIYQAMMDKQQLARSRVHEVAAGPDISQLAQGTVDVWPGHIGADSYALSQRHIDYNVVSPPSYGIHVPGTVYFATEDTIGNDPEFVRRILQAVLHGWALAYDDYSKSIPLIAGFDSPRLAPDFIRFSLDQQRQYLRPFAARFGEFDEAEWRTLQDIMVQQRIIKEPLDLSKAITLDFLRDAYRRPILSEN